MAVLRSHEAITRRQNFILAVESDDANTSLSGDVIYFPMTAVKKGLAFHSIQSTIFPLHLRALGYTRVRCSGRIPLPVSRFVRSKGADRQFRVSEVQRERDVWRRFCLDTPSLGEPLSVPRSLRCTLTCGSGVKIADPTEHPDLNAEGSIDLFPKDLISALAS